MYQQNSSIGPYIIPATEKCDKAYLKYLVSSPETTIFGSSTIFIYLMDYYNSLEKT